MGVEVSHYVMVGIDLLSVVKPMNDNEVDYYFERMDDLERNTDLKFIYDGMSGEYCFLGMVLNKFDDYEDGSKPRIHHFASDLYHVREYVKEVLVNENISTTEPSLISFTHWR